MAALADSAPTFPTMKMCTRPGMVHTPTLVGGFT